MDETVRTAAQAPSAAQAPKIKKKRKWPKRVIALVIVLAVIGGAAFGIKAKFFGKTEAVALTGTTTYGALASTIQGTGTTAPSNTVSVSLASNTADILQVRVSAGDQVEEGDLLYVQDDAELDERIADFNDQIANLRETLADYYDQIEDYQKQIKDYHEQIADHKATIAALTVTAPITGHVTEVFASEGDTAQKGGRLMTLVDDSKMTLTQYFSYVYEGDIHLGMEANLSVSSLMRNFAGTVTDIQKVERITTEGTRCFAVTITVENPGALTEGMTGAAWLLGKGGEKIYPAIEGMLKYNATKTVTAPAAGELTAVRAVVYQKVTAGQTLAVIDGENYLDQIESIQDRITQTGKNISQVQDRIEQTEKKIATLQENIESAEEERADFEVHAEISGKVISVGVKEGALGRMMMGSAVSIYNLDTVTISANIDELDIDYITMGMEVTIVRAGSSRNSTYVGHVTEISYEATNSNGVAYFPITIEIDSHGELAAGVNVSYYISTGGDATEGVLAPLAALKSTTAGACLFVKADRRPENAVDLESGVVPDGFYAVPVEVGATNYQYAKILSGVEAGVEVFTRYQNTAPTNGDTTSTGGEEEQQFSFPGGDFDPSQFGGSMPGGSFSGGNRGGSSGSGNRGGFSGGPSGFPGG